jgi:hypothetical protein
LKGILSQIKFLCFMMTLRMSSIDHCCHWKGWCPWVFAPNEFMWSKIDSYSTMWKILLVVVIGYSMNNSKNFKNYQSSEFLDNTINFPRYIEDKRWSLRFLPQTENISHPVWISWPCA